MCRTYNFFTYNAIWITISFYPIIQVKSFSTKKSQHLESILLYSWWTIQPWPLAYKRLLNKPYVNEVNLTGQKPPLKYCQDIEIQYAVRKKSRSFNAKNFGSVDQRAAKLLAAKVGLLKKKSAASAIPPKVCASAFGPGSSTPGVKSFSMFDSWQL